MNLADPIDILARTIWAEARSGGADAMTHVASAVLNRAGAPRWWGHDILSVCLHPWQFSCWNPHTVGAAPDHNYLAMCAVTEVDPDFAAALGIARHAAAGTLPDATQGADSYFADGSQTPAWTQGATATLDDGCNNFWITRHIAHAPSAYRPSDMAEPAPCAPLTSTDLPALAGRASAGR